MATKNPSHYLTTAYSLGGNQVFPAYGKVIRDGVEQKLTRRQLEVLAALVAAEGELVRRSDLIESIWDGNTLVGERAITNVIYHLRRVLEAPAAEPMIQTISRKGYMIRTGLVTTGPTPVLERGSTATCEPQETGTRPVAMALVMALPLAALLLIALRWVTGTPSVAASPPNTTAHTTLKYIKTEDPLTMRRDRILHRLHTVAGISPQARAAMLISVAQLEMRLGNEKSAAASFHQALMLRDRASGENSVDSASILIAMASVEPDILRETVSAEVFDRIMVVRSSTQYSGFQVKGKWRLTTPDESSPALVSQAEY